MFSALCVLLLRLVEDGVVQLQETNENVEGLEEEAVRVPHVLSPSVHWEPVCLYNCPS